jgi:DNA-binding transcriptional regulator YdaS (Cro superfamily)
MQLSDYLTRENISASRFAGQVGVYPSTVTRWLRRERRPSIAQAARIEAATAGEVSANDFLPGVAPGSHEAAE